jgi:hypothetical protein
MTEIGQSAGWHLASSIQHLASSPISLAIPDYSADNARAMLEAQKTPLPPELPLFRFRLRHIFAFFAVTSALLTELVVVRGVAGLALAMATLVVLFSLDLVWLRPFTAGPLAVVGGDRSGGRRNSRRSHFRTIAERFRVAGRDGGRCVFDRRAGRLVRLLGQ